MKIDGVKYRSVWVDEGDRWTVRIIDQTRLPWSLDVIRLQSSRAAAHAIRSMQVRGAPLIGAVAAYGLALALRDDSTTHGMEAAAAMLNATRPTAVNLGWALNRMLTRLHNTPAADRVAVAYEEAGLIADEDVAQCESIGAHGQELIEEVAATKRIMRGCRFMCG
jgi:methylthioribose-1-phosphate isomerase